MKDLFHHKEAEKIISGEVFRRLWIVSGGQSGVDRAAMEFALRYRLPVRGWCPRGRIAEDGVIAANIPVQESDDSDPALRTELNVYDSDATLVLTYPEVRDGTVLTEDCARSFSRPLLTFLIDREPDSQAIGYFREWVANNQIRILNIAGPRESFRPGEVYVQASIWLEHLLLRRVEK